MTRRYTPQRDLFGARPVRRPQVERADLVDIELIHLADRDTDLAHCVQKTAITQPVYLPRTLTELHGGVFTFPRWLAIEKGLT